MTLQPEACQEAMQDLVTHIHDHKLMPGDRQLSIFVQDQIRLLIEENKKLKEEDKELRTTINDHVCY